MGSIFGNCLKISLFGESHGPAIGVTLDHFPAGVLVDETFLRELLARRRPNGGVSSTKRKEGDSFEILSGLYRGRTTGTPLCAICRNGDTRSGDYDALRSIFRPSHGDYTGEVRYHGFQDPRGGGHFSGRLTAPMVFAGGLALLALRERGITLCARVVSIGGETEEAAMQELMARTARGGDSVGGVIELVADGVAPGIGSPIFGGVESRLSAALFAIPAVKGVEFGTGFAIAAMRGSEANDAFCLQNGKIATKTNHSGGLQGGITNGMSIVVRCAMKPTPSIALPQDTLDTATGAQTELRIGGRHDSCIVPRAVPVVESMGAVALLDLIVEASGYERD